LRTKKFRIELAFWAIPIIVLFQQAKWDANPHHDGVILAPAVAVVDGHTPNLDFFSQYGFLIPYIHGIALKIFGGFLLTLRFMTVIEVLLTALFVYLILLKQLDRKLSLSIAIAWAVSFPHLLPFLPWPSVTSTLFMTVACWLILNRSSRSEHKILELYATYCLISLSVLIRPQIVLSLALFILWLIRNHSFRSMAFVRQLIFIFSLPFIFVSFAIHSRLLSSYISQSWLWAGGNYGGIGVTVRGLVELLLFPSISGIVLFGLWGINFSRKRKFFVSYWVIVIWLSLVTMIYFSWTYLDFPYIAIKHPRVLLADLGWNSLNALSFTSLALLLGALIHHIVGIKQTRKISFSGNSLVLYISSLSAIQLYPATDPLHFWWLAPLFLIGAVSNLNKVNERKISINATLCVILTYISLCGVNFMHDYSMTRINYQSRVLAGMRGAPSQVNTTDKTVEAISRLPSAAGVKFDCADGLYAVSSGHYMPNNLAFVNWAPKSGTDTDPEKYIFQCNLPSQTPVPVGYKISWKIPIKSALTGQLTGLENRIITLE
jgi:hypothetical protein